MGSGGTAVDSGEEVDTKGKRRIENGMDHRDRTMGPNAGYPVRGGVHERQRLVGAVVLLAWHLIQR